jgi:signal peptidase II
VRPGVEGITCGWGELIWGLPPGACDNVWHTSIFATMANMNSQLQKARLTGNLWAKLIAFALLTVLVVTADQWTKHLVMKSIDPGSGVVLIPGFVNIVHTRNTGAAFGILSETGAGFRSTFLLLVSVAALLAILGIVFSSKKMDAYLIIGFSLFFGGALGNLVDRIRFGEVVDFLDLYVRNYHWPAFNVADSALCIGVGFFLIQAVRGTHNS